MALAEVRHAWRRTLAALHWRFVLLSVPLAVAALLVLALAADHLAAEAFRRQALAGLETARTAGAMAAGQYLGGLTTAVAQLAEDPGTAQAFGAFSEATRALDDGERADAPRLSAQRDRLRDALAQFYASQVAANEVDPHVLVPSNPAALRLQAHYLADEPGADDSPYGAAHASWDARFVAAAARAGVSDLLLVRAGDGRIVYDTAKLPLFQTSLVDGPYADSHLGAFFRRLRATHGGGAQVADFAAFLPMRGRPAAFIGAPLEVHGELVGAVIAALTPDGLTQALRGGERWDALGLGGSGDVMLIGADGTLRSEPRALALLARGEADIAAHGSAVGAFAPALVAASGGPGQGTFAGRYLDAHGIAKLGGVAPAGIAGVNWRVAAEIDEPEALRPLATLRRQIVAAALVLCGIVACALAGGALLTTAPLRRVIAAIAALRPNGGAARVPSLGHGEAEALATAVNELLEQQRAANAAERRRRDGELRGVIAALDAARAGDPTQRAYAGGDLGALATAVNAVCEQLGERAAAPPLAAEPVSADALLAAAEHLRSEAARHLDALAAADASLQQVAARVERDTQLAARAVDAGRLASAAAASAHGALDCLGAALQVIEADGRRAGETWDRLAAQSDALLDARTALDGLATELGVTAVNAALVSAPAAGALTAASVEQMGQIAERAAAACGEFDRIGTEIAGAARDGAVSHAHETGRVARCAEAAGALRNEAERLAAALRECDALLGELTCVPAELSEQLAAVGAARDAARRLSHAAEVVAREAGALCPSRGGPDPGVVGTAVFPLAGAD